MNTLLFSATVPLYSLFLSLSESYKISPPYIQKGNLLEKARISRDREKNTVYKLRNWPSKEIFEKKQDLPEYTGT